MGKRRKNWTRQAARDQPGQTPVQKNSKSEPRKEGELCTREIAGAIRQEEDARSFELSFSSEEPYNRGWCVEVLDHSEGAVDLTRLNEIGVVLFNHDRDRVLGRIERAWIEDGRGKAAIVFDDDDKAAEIADKVRSGTLKGVSVGYRVKTWEIVENGETSSNGKYQGPCDVATSWEPFEISIVSVPADASVGVGRDMEDTADRPEAPEADAEEARDMWETYQRQLIYNKNMYGGA